ncbi:MAG: type I 3-dehydroquinate dehydratase [Eubacteriales bacterium]|nr:type I 3-dehydroquinate dehydratase [Eubacteriales bacterium]
MNPTATIRNLTLGTGRPKICVPIVGRDREEILGSAQEIKKHIPDLVEWRIDFLQSVEEMLEILPALRKALEETPLLVTFRTKEEGGERAISPAEYTVMYQKILETGMADAIDVQLFLGEDIVTALVEAAKQHGVKVVGSSHDFSATPAEEEILARLCRMQELGMDIAKIAVMPKDEEDLLRLLHATWVMKERYAKVPIITMSMGPVGMLSRLCGEVFGSALTFGTVGKASAPGQIPVEELRTALALMAKN